MTLARRDPLPVPLESEIAEEPLSQEDYEAIKDVLASWPWAYPHLVFCKLLRASGLRMAEVLRLTRGQVRRQGPAVQIQVYRGKKRGLAKWEWVPIKPEFGADLLAFRDGLPPGRERIFPFQALAFERAFGKAGLVALGWWVTPHQVRGLYATYGMEHGESLEDMATMLGHTDPRTTLKFYHKLTAKRRHEINQRVPV